MKKKILLTLLIVSVLVCIFAIGVSATTYYYDVDDTSETPTAMFQCEYDDAKIITSYSGSFAKTNALGEALTWYAVETVTEGNGDVSIYVRDFVTTDPTYSTIDASGVYRYVTSTGATFKTVVSVNFPSDAGIKKLSDNQNWDNAFVANAGDYSPDKTELLFLYLPNTLTYLPGRLVQATTVLEVEFALGYDKDVELTLGNTAFYQAKCLRSVKNIPASVTKLSAGGTDSIGTFYYCVNLQAITLEEGTKLNYIGGSAFNGCTSLQSFTIPDAVTYVGDNAFRSCGITNNPFGANSLCSEIGKYAFVGCQMTSLSVPANIVKFPDHSANGYYGAFAQCPNLKTVTFNEGSKLEYLGKHTFADCDSLEEVSLPNTVFSVGERVFESCSVLHTIRLGAKSTNLTQSFTYLSPNIRYVYLSSTIKTVTGSHAFNAAKSDAVFFFTGTYDEYVALNDLLIAGKDNSPFTGATPIAWDSEKGEDYYKNLATTENKRYVVYNFNVCNAFYNSIHDIKLEGDNKCCGTCENCGLTEMLENPEHTSNWIFNNGGSVSLVAQIKAEHKCVYCKTVEETKTIDAIFTSTGYSYEMNGNEYTGIYQRTSVDKEALALYAELTGNKDSYNFGIVAGLAAGANDNPIDGNLITAINGEADAANDTTVIGTFLNTEYTIMEIKVTGVTSASQLYCGAFIVTGNDVTYLCGTTQNNVATKATFPQ